MKQQRPATARSVADGLKLHRHEVRSPGAVRTVITLRPGTHARFSTNRFHETWHVLSDEHGARLLARLLWGLSYQARPGTVVLIDRPYLTATPFDADPADRIVLVPGWCTPFDDRSARGLRAGLPFQRSAGTVRWRTFGLDRTLRPEALEKWWDVHRHRDETGTIVRRHGLIVLTPSTPEEARIWALRVAGLDTAGAYGSDHAYLGPWNGGFDGEVQIFRRFRPMLSVARRARAQVLARPAAPTTTEALREQVWDECETVRHDAHLHIRVWRDGAHDIRPAAATMLSRAKVTSLEDLAALGSVETYRRLRAVRTANLTFETLWAMEAALTDRPVTPTRRRELLTDLGPAPRPHRRRYRTPIHPRPRRRVPTTRFA
ncbi:TfoX/Sxy family DNA transformation protein [Nocardia takedensis]